MSKFKSFTEYNENQIILNSDRLIFNAKKDSIFLISNTNIAFSANDSVHFNIGSKSGGDKNNKFVINSPKIQLGLDGRGSSLESIGKGDSIETVINELLNALTSFSTSLASAVGTGVGTVTLLSINAASNKLLSTISNIKPKVEKIKSKTSYTI